MRIAAAFFLVLVCSLSGSSADIEGYLVDKACSSKATKDGYAKAGACVKECALMDGCINSDFGVLTADNKYILFDAAGAKKVVAALQDPRSQTTSRSK